MCENLIIMYEIWDARLCWEAAHSCVTWQKVIWYFLCEMCYLTKSGHDTCLCIGCTCSCIVNKFEFKDKDEFCGDLKM